jgi:hypothetical protein
MIAKYLILIAILIGLYTLVQPKEFDRPEWHDDDGCGSSEAIERHGRL